MKRLVCLLAALCLLAGCTAPAEQTPPANDVPANDAPAAAENEVPTNDVPADETSAAAPTDDSAPVLTCGDFTMTSAQFQYYFGRQYAAILDAYGDSAFDPSKELAAQPYDDSQSWETFLTEQAFNLAEQTQMLCLGARAAGLSTVEGEAVTDEEARGLGYADAQALLTALYGEGAESEGYAAFARDMATAAAFSEQLSTGVDHTEADLEACYDANAENYETVFHLPKNDQRAMDVRIITFYPDDLSAEADWADAETRARAVWQEFQADPTDAAFAALADARTEDFNAPDGGLYEGLHPGGESALYDWLYPESGARAVGDAELIRENDAWDLCYISAVDERPYWQIAVEQDLRRDDYIRAMDELRQTYVFERHPENIDLRVPTAHNAERFAGVEAVG